MARTTRFGALCLIVLVGVALAATAMCPRGILRATSVSQADAPVERSVGPELDAVSSERADLPGVPPLRIREEEGHEHLPLALAMSALASERTDQPAPGPWLAQPPDDLEVIPSSAVPPRPGGDRAPPRSI